MRKYSAPASSDSSGTSITIGTSDTTNYPPCGLKVSPNIDDIWQSVTPYLRKSNKLDTTIDGKLPNHTVAMPILTDVLNEKLSDSPSRDIYMRCRMNLTADLVNIPAPQFVDLGLSTIDTLDKYASI